jgi:hypothetical protein
VSGDANGSRLRHPDHVVEQFSYDDGLTLLGRQDAGAQPRSDKRLPYRGHLMICSKPHGKGEHPENARRSKSRLPLKPVLKEDVESGKR